MQLDLPRVASLFDLYVHLFGMPEATGGIDPKRLFEHLYTTEFSVYRACQEGSIGVRALEPEALRQYMRGDVSLPKPPAAGSPEKAVSFNIYQTWIIAMLHSNDKLLDLAQRTAEALYTRATNDDRGKATSQRAVEDILKASRLREFIERLTPVVSSDDSDLFDCLVGEMMQMSSSDVPLLLTLIRFKYAVARA